MRTNTRHVLLLAAIFGTIAPAVASDDPTIEGTVLDTDGRPAPDIEVGYYWSANGWFDDQGARRPILDVWKHIGGMRTLAPNTTDADGRFALKAEPADAHRAVMAMDAARRLAGIARSEDDGRLTIRLEPLTRVFGRVRPADGEPEPDWRSVYVLTPERERFPLTRDRLAHCGNYADRFEFLLPPGEYVLEGYASNEADEIEFRMDRPKPVTVAAAGGNLDVGDLVVRRRDEAAEVAKADATAGNYADLYGRPLPPWYATDARDIPADARPADFAGRWVVFYFWGAGCLPCLREGLPKLTEFEAAHPDSRDRFAIVTVFEGLESEGITSLRDFDAWLDPIERRVWKRKLTLPVLLDTTYRTRKSLGLRFYGTPLLIDPAGHLVPVDPAPDGDPLQPILDRLTTELERQP